MKNRIINDIIECSKITPVKVFFDMDGVLAEYEIDRQEVRKDKNSHYYLTRRPISIIINIAKKLSSFDNIEVCILSNCHHDEDRIDKTKWLMVHAPFFKPENIFIMVYEKLNITTKDEKQNIKTKFLLNKFRDKNDVVFHIDDDVNIIHDMKKEQRINVIHVSSLID